MGDASSPPVGGTGAQRILQSDRVQARLTFHPRVRRLERSRMSAGETLAAELVLLCRVPGFDEFVTKNVNFQI